VLINGQVVEQGVTVERAADAPAVAQVVEASGIEVTDSVTIELVPQSGLPVLNAVEAIAE
jgi:hypothetical protein